MPAFFQDKKAGCVLNSLVLWHYLTCINLRISLVVKFNAKIRYPLDGKNKKNADL